MNLSLYLEPAAPPTLRDAVTFETGASREQTIDPTVWAYDHHGPTFGPSDRGALTALWEDLVRGRPTPSVLVCGGRVGPDTVVGAAMFMHRELLLMPEALALVGLVELVHRHGHSMLAHTDPTLGRFLKLLLGFFSDDLSVDELRRRLPLAVGWVRSYLADGQLPSLGAPFPSSRILTVGAGGFVAASADGDLKDAWLDLYRQGYLRGVLFGPRESTMLPVCASRKSFLVPFDLERARFRLNEAEIMLGGTPTWKVTGNYLWGPSQGTLVLAADVIEAVSGADSFLDRGKRG